MGKEKIDYEQELINDMAMFEKDPLGFIYYAFPWGEKNLKDKEPEEWQIERLNQIKSKLEQGESVNEAIQTAVASGHGIGKSALVSWLILWAISTYEDTKGVVTANTDRQLMTKTWPELTKWYQMCITKHWFKCTATAIYSAEVEHEKTWRIDAIPWSINNTEAFAGLHNEGKRIIVIFDEASAVDDKIWEVTEGALTDANTQIIWCVFGNPTRNTGRFRDCFGRLRHRWFTKQIDSRTVKITNKEQLQKWIDDYGINSDFVKVRVRGMFPSMSAKQFISVEDVDMAFGKHLREEQFNFAPKILSVEPAWEGDDPLIIGIRQGLAFRILRKIPKNDNDIEIANIVAQLEDLEQADGVVIDQGYGTGIVSAGRTMGRDWMLVCYSSSSPEPGYKNLRAYMWGKMKEWLKSGGAIPSDQEMYDDLIGPETIPTMDGIIQLEAKKDMKARGIPSPNKGDCLAQTFAFNIQKKNKNPFSKGNLKFAVHEIDLWGR
jgi:hypothetical protein